MAEAKQWKFVDSIAWSRALRLPFVSNKTVRRLSEIAEGDAKDRQTRERDYWHGEKRELIARYEKTLADLQVFSVQQAQRLDEFMQRQVQDLDNGRKLTAALSIDVSDLARGVGDLTVEVRGLRADTEAILADIAKEIERRPTRECVERVVSDRTSEAISTILERIDLARQEERTSANHVIARVDKRASELAAHINGIDYANQQRAQHARTKKPTKRKARGS